METELPEYLSNGEHYASYHPVGEMTLADCVSMIDGAIRYCRDNGIGSLLVNITGVSGFPPPSTTDRFLFTKHWAETAAGKLAVAMVAPPEMIDLDKIGVTMAGNRGLRSDVFTLESDAIEWLLSRS
ncbi:MAG: hypothetical protein WBC19_07765 [Pyrinomonadaceae bacterium]